MEHRFRRPGHDAEFKCDFHILRFSDEGNPDPDTRVKEIVDCIETWRQDSAPGVVVVVFIHGWQGDMPAARSQYAAWMRTLMALSHDVERARAKRPGFVPLLIGLHWPSLPFGDESLDRPASFGIDGGGALDVEIDAAARQIADTPAARTALRTIFQSAQGDFAPASLPPEVAEAYRILDREAGLDAEGVEGDPGADREPFDPQKAYALALEDDISFGGGGVRGALLSPLRQLSFWKMKERAKRVG